MSLRRSIGWILVLACALGCAAPAPVAAQVRTLKAVTLRGMRYVALKDLAAMYGLPLTALGPKTLLIRGQYTSLQFTTDSRQATLNGSLVWLHLPVTKIRGNWSLSDADAQFVVDPLVRPSAYLGARGARTVVIDPGHGGKDPGAISRTGYQEKDLVLDIALRLKTYLAARGIRAILTRDVDRFWTLEDRPFLAARNRGDAFVSLHLNSAASRSVRGIETFVTPAANHPATGETKTGGKYPAVPNNQFNHSNTALGNQIQRAVIGITRAEDRGLKRARFIVLKNSAMPAALVECGFLSNPQEAQKLATSSYRQTLAQGIAQGVLNFFALVNRAKLELGAPLIQKPTQVASALAPAPAPAPLAPLAPTPMAARAAATSTVPVGGTPVPVVSAAAPPPPPAVPPAPLAPAPPAAMIAVPPAPAPAAPPPAAPEPPVPAIAPPPVAPPPPPPPAPPKPMQAMAPPPRLLLNPNLAAPAK